MAPALVAFGVALGVSIAFVRVPALGVLLTRRAGASRWRVDSVPLAGGLAMAAGLGVAVALFERDLPDVGPIYAAAGVALLVGLWDDLRSMRPATKLAGQAVAGVTLAALGLRIDLGLEPVAWIVTVAWVVVVANAVNLLDNMDGVAGGVALVASSTLWLWWSIGTGPAGLAAALSGSIAGFLVLNLHPARLFMGDAGSHVLGVVLAGLTLADAGRAGSTGEADALTVLLVPALLLAVPLFDTALVTVERARRGRPVWEGGSDHTSHRLVVAGLSVGWTAVVLWLAAATAAGVASLAVVGGPWLLAGAVVMGGAAIAAWWRLARIEV